MVADDPESFADIGGHAQTGEDIKSWDESSDADKPPKPAAHCLLCWLRRIFRDPPSIPAPPGRPEIAVSYNTLAEFYNFGAKLAELFSNRTHYLVPLMKASNSQDANDMKSLDMALLFVPELGEVELLNDGLEIHHLLPREFEGIFEEAGLDIEEYTVTIRKSKHRLRVGNGLHTNLNPGGNWNRVWEKFLANPKNRTAPVILEQLDRMILNSFHSGPA